MKPVIIYIVGAGNSGSTILSMALGAHSKMISVGEFSQLDRFRALNLRCSCGEPFSECPFWTSIINNSSFMGPVEPMNTLYKLLTSKKGSIRSDPHYSMILENNYQLYKNISEHTGKSIIIDSSKDLIRLYYLYCSGEFTIIPVYLVRDGRAYIDSMQRRGYARTYRYILRWIWMNFRTEYVLKKLMRCFEMTINIDYNMFAQKPGNILEGICKKVGVEYEYEMLDYYQNIFHNIAGTRSRFSLKPITSYEGWRERLSNTAKLQFNLMGGKLFNKRFGIGSDRDNFMSD